MTARTQRIVPLVVVLLCACRRGEPTPTTHLEASGGTEGTVHTGTAAVPDGIRRTPRVTFRRPSVRGSLPRGAVVRVVKGHINELRQCYTRGLQYNPELEGLVTLDFEIDAEGRVSRPGLRGSTIGDRAVPRCIVKELGGWHFPSPRDGDVVEVTYPIDLEPD